MTHNYFSKTFVVGLRGRLASTPVFKVAIFNVAGSIPGRNNVGEYLFYIVSGVGVCGIVVYDFHNTSTLLTLGSEQRIW